MVLVDTSVWLRFLRDELPYAAEMSRLLDNDKVAGHELVYGELLIGDKGGRARLLAAYSRMQRMATITHIDVVEFVRARRFHGRGAGWIDIHLLASALASRVELWTADRSLFILASELGIAYEMPNPRPKYLT